MSSKNQIANNRIYYLDYLRFFSSLAIIFLHVASANMGESIVTGYEWNIFNFYNSLVRWGVPVFLMISGALFLPKEIETKKLYSKYILRMGIAYFVWSVFYAIAVPAGKYIADNSYEISISEILKNCITGETHMWFIPMIIGMYMCIPLIKPIIKNESTLKYFLILSFIFLFVKTQISSISYDFLSGTISEGIAAFDKLTSNMNMSLVVGYVPYFILGYALNEIELSSKKRTVIYILGAIGFIATIVLNAWVSIKANQSLDSYHRVTTLNIFLESVSVFVWFKYNIKGNDRLNKIMGNLSKYSFGAYLVHIFVLCCLSMVKLESTSFNPVLSVPIITVITAVASFGISFIMHQIPVVKKYLV